MHHEDLLLQEQALRKLFIAIGNIEARNLRWRNRMAVKFEYKVLMINPEWNVSTGRDNIESQLNELGQDGWDLVPITVEGYLFLKRAKADAKD